MKFFHSFLSNLLGSNIESTPPELIIHQMNEPRPLPLGREEFEEWSNRIIAGTMLPTAHLKSDEDRNNFIEMQKCTLAGFIMHLGPTESHKPDAYFIHGLRKGAANEVAHTIGRELREKTQERLRRKEAEEKAKKEAANEGISSTGPTL
jgi:hypothetical protein